MNNSLPAHFINLVTLQLLRLSFSPYKPLAQKQDPPLLVSGIFRSGTSITTNILSHAGFDPGPQNHLMQAKGKYYERNPDGFLENFFFMELSMYLFKLTNSAGDNPPDEKIVEKINVELLSDDELRKHSLLVTHDDRVSNINKLRSLRKVSVQAIQNYLSNAFGEKPIIKNPHFSVLEPFFKKIFPDSKRVVVFRNPADWLRSVQVVTTKADYQLYDLYYRHYLESKDAEIIFFDYDKLLADPKKSIADLLHALQMNIGSIDSLAKLVVIKEGKNNKEIYSQLTPVSYSQLTERAVNR